MGVSTSLGNTRMEASRDTEPHATLTTAAVDEPCHLPIRLRTRAPRWRMNVVDSQARCPGDPRTRPAAGQAWPGGQLRVGLRRCRSRAEIGIPATPDESFVLDDDGTVASVQRAHRAACEASRRATSPLGLDDVIHGNRRGPLLRRWVYVHVLRELAQHCGHADILREQILSE
jgi:Protein of unknown function (DUF664)